MPVATTVVVAVDQVVDPEDALDVVDPVLGGVGDLGARERPELALHLAAQAAQRGGRDDALHARRRSRSRGGRWCRGSRR